MELRNRHPGETATIVGCGLSILKLTPADFPAGPVIALNHSILNVRALGLPNLVYSQQKDGCILHGPQVQVPINECICPFGPEMVQPVEPEELVLCWAESSHCFPLYPRRHVIDVQKDFGLSGWCVSSAPFAVMLAHAMGCTSLRMLGHDAYTTGDTGRIPGSATEVDPATGVNLEGIKTGYRLSGESAQWIAEKFEMAVEWV